MNNNGTWTQQAKLTSPTGSATDLFGQSLAIQGDTLVVGAAGVQAAYVYTDTSGQWTLQAVLTPSGGSGASFGGSPTKGVAINGGTIAIGAPAEATAAGNTGSVYVFTGSGGTWSQQARIVPTDPVVFGLYGQCVSLDGSTAVIGAQRPSEAEVFVLANDAWSLQQIIAGPDDSDFGTSVNVIGDMLVVTACEDVSPIGFQSGAAHLYTRGGSTWTEHFDLLMAPGVNGIPGPVQDKQRFGNFSAMTRMGSQTAFVFDSQTFSEPSASQVGAVYTATLN